MSNLAGYPQAVGTKRVSVIEHAGPTSYVQFTTSGGGDVVDHHEFGTGHLEAVTAPMMDPTGTYYARVWKKAAGPVPSVALQWIVVATGAEVAGAVDLATYTLTLVGRGL